MYISLPTIFLLIVVWLVFRGTLDDWRLVGLLALFASLILVLIGIGLLLFALFIKDYSLAAFIGIPLGILCLPLAIYQSIHEKRDKENKDKK